jgi:hypothetical protein
VELPLDYTPSTNDIVCGRGKGSYNRSGNRQMRAIVGTYAADYVAARTKFEKSTILQRIVDDAKDAGGHFVRRANNQWYEIMDETAREKVGYV